MARKTLVPLMLAGAAASDIMITTFDGAKETTQSWKEQDDPVMGGKSKGTFTVDSDNNAGVFDGTCAIVPRLNAPGFIKATAVSATPDVSSCKNLVINVNSKTDYKGYKISFGNVHYPGTRFFHYGYKANFKAPVGKFEDVVLPFDSFTSNWNDATGEPITTCADDAKACVTKASLKDLQTISIWGEGTEGDVHLQVKSIRASGCDGMLQSLESQWTSISDMLEASNGVTLATFDGAEGTTFKFGELNDPVMGGRSTGTFKVDSQNKVGVFDGEVVNVPSLKAPGFIKVAGDAKYFPDASAVDSTGNVVLTLRSSEPDYKGYRVTVVSGAVNAGFACAGGGAIIGSRGCYKAKFDVPRSVNSEFQAIKIPLSSFSDLWSSATGEHTKECADDSSACLTPAKLAKIQRLELWAEGVAGKANLEVQKIAVEASDLGSSVQGGTLMVTWSDCGDATYHGKVNSVSPDTLVIGQKNTVTGSGTTDEPVTGGAFKITAKVGFLSPSYSGDICTAKTFSLPLGVGSVTWKGVKCPVAVGAVDVALDVSLASAIPSSLARAQISAKATDSNGANLLCMSVTTAPAEVIVV